MIDLSKLHAFVDGELSEAEQREVALRISECKESQAEVASIRQVKSVLGASSSCQCEEVWAKCQGRLDAIDRVAKSGNFITKYSWAFVSAVALIVVVGGGFSRNAQATSVDSSALAGIFSGSGHSSPEKASRNAKLDRLLQNVDQSLSKISLVAVASGYINGLPAQRYDLQDSHGRLMLIVLPKISSFEGMAPNGDGKYFYGQIEAKSNAVGWKINGAALILVGQRDYAELESIARAKFVLPE